MIRGITAAINSILLGMLTFVALCLALIGTMIQSSYHFVSRLIRGAARFLAERMIEIWALVYICSLLFLVLTPGFILISIYLFTNWLGLIPAAIGAAWIMIF